MDTTSAVVDSALLALQHQFMADSAALAFKHKIILEIFKNLPSEYSIASKLQSFFKKRPETFMNRREALHRVALLMGGAVSAPLWNAAMSGCAPSSRQVEKPWLPQTLTPEQNELVTAIAEMILPATDTPGAKAAKVNEFIDLILTEWYPVEERARFMSGLHDLTARFQNANGKGFLEGTPEQQTAMLTTLDNEALAVRQEGVKELPFFGMMKELTLVGYYTSTIGMTDELEFQPATDRFEGCIPLGRVGKTWAELN